MAEVAQTPLDSYDLTVETKVNIDELIYQLNYEDLPMLGGIGADGFPTIPRQAVDNRIFYWLEEDLPVPRSALNGALADGTGTSVVLDTGTTVGFAVGDVIRVEAELMKITAVTNGTHTLTVTRAFGGTTGVAHVDNSEVIGLGTALNEGDIGNQQFAGRDKYSNYTQIFTSKISMTRTSQRIPKYGVPSELAKQVRSVMLSEGINMEQALLYGVKYESDPIRTTGGLAQFITTNTINAAASGDWLTLTEIEQAQQLSYDAGGAFNAIVGNPKVFAALNNLTDTGRIATVTIDDQRRGRRRATVVMTEFGEVELVRNRYVRSGNGVADKAEAFGINRENVVARIMQPMVMQPLAKTDDRDNWMFVAELGFEVKGQRHMVYWTGLDPTAALPASGLV